MRSVESCSVQSAYKYGRKKPCPNCRGQKFNYYMDRRGMNVASQLYLSEVTLLSTCTLGKRSIDALGVKCSNAKRCLNASSVGFPVLSNARMIVKKLSTL